MNRFHILFGAILLLLGPVGAADAIPYTDGYGAGPVSTWGVLFGNHSTTNTDALVKRNNRCQFSERRNLQLAILMDSSFLQNDGKGRIVTFNRSVNTKVPGTLDITDGGFNAVTQEVTSVLVTPDFSDDMGAFHTILLENVYSNPVTLPTDITLPDEGTAPSPVPEPSTMLLIGIGLIGLCVVTSNFPIIPRSGSRPIS